MIIGYARLLAEEQTIDLHLSALKNAGCDQIYIEHARSSQAVDRATLDEVIKRLQPNETLVVGQLAELATSLSGLLRIMHELGKRRVHLRSLAESIDTSRSRDAFTLMAVLAEFERSHVSRRTRAGIAAARASGKHVGRPKSLTQPQIDYLVRSHQSGQLHLQNAAARFNVSARTLRRYVASHEQAALSQEAWPPSDPTHQELS